MTDHDRLVDIHNRMVRLETRVTTAMAHLGYRPGVDHKRNVEDRAMYRHGEVHVTTPNVPLSWALEALVAAGQDSADLYVAGGYVGRITSNGELK